ncbi:LysR family transcriptional regulator [Neobacillus sp. PS3-12]|uniref:LysR family transcriptional regulator n=1 Tax=Neobacillus sp. PS3-12 TaxID=3070677 RepID=UPI0027DFD4F6|nr:LysR family transcriptional regulator [Neobacillus sp. PS3-12]WML51272.1 LysR family transcriptional regulator [Neobacillus sp. PS3-12]
MDDEQLLTFITVYELNNYSRTADHLNLTQPAVTARIQKLEIELGCKLFYRDGKKILLTQEGKALLPFARKILSYINEARQTIELLKTPTITIGLSPAISVSLVLDALTLLRESEEQSFDMLEAADSVEVSKMVESGLVDIGLVRDVIPFPNLESKKIFHEKLFFIVGKGHPLAAKTEIKKEDLMNQTMICYRRESALWQKIDEKLVGVKDLKRIEVGGFEMLLSMVKNNWGFCIVPELILSKNIKNDFYIIPFPDFEDLTYNITGVYKKDFPKFEKLLLLLQSFESTLKELQNHLNV